MKIFILYLTLVVLSGTSFAQTYTIKWFTIDGGGGASSGGAYNVTGTIGQPDAGVQRNGGLTLIGGFWGTVSVVQTLGAPELGIRRDPSTKGVVIFWSAPIDGWVLEEAGRMESGQPGSWSSVNLTYAVNGTEYSVSIPSPTGNRYYRLRKR